MNDRRKEVLEKINEKLSLNKEQSISMAKIEINDILKENPQIEKYIKNKIDSNTNSGEKNE